MDNNKACKILTYDLVIVGAGLAGINTAISAGRNGLRVALIGNRPVLGGNASVEIGIDINGACYNSLYSPSVYARETGVIEEIKQNIFHYAGYESYKSASYDGALFDSVYNEKNIDLYLNTQAVSVNCKDDQVEWVDCIQITTDKKFRFYSHLFSDCSGDGFLAYMAGADFMVGSEGRDEFNEGLAPSKKNKFVNGATLMFRTIKTGKKENYIPPAFAYDITKMPFFKDLGSKKRVFYQNKVCGGYQGFWWVEYGGHLDMIADSEEITDELRKIVYGIWDYIKNSGNFEDVEDQKLVWVGSVLGKRESRRFTGDYILNQNDILIKKEFDDACYCAGWPMDIHADYGIYDSNDATFWNFVPGMYNGPLRTLYSKNIKNLFFAGRNISCTRVANSSTRIMATCSVEGQAVGVAAFLCQKYDCFPREIYKLHIKELQKILLQQDQTLVGYREKYDIKNAKVTCSSEKTLQNKVADFSSAIIKDLVLAIPVADKKIDSIDIFVRNNGGKTQFKYAILSGRLKECYLPEEIVYEGSVGINENYDGAITLAVNSKRGEDCKIYIRLYVNEQIEVYYTKKSLTGVPSFTLYEKNKDERDSRIFVLTRLRNNICFTNLLPPQNIYGGNNVLSGYNRPYGLPNLWISEKKEGQYLIIDFDEKEVEKIQLVFNTDLAEDIITFQAKQTICDYELVVEGTYYKKIFSIHGNYQRINSFEINHRINKIIFIPKENYGLDYFELFGIKIY